MWEPTNEQDDDIVAEEELEEVLDLKPKKRKRKSREDRETDDYVSKDEMWNELYSYYEALGEHYDWENQKLLRKDEFPSISNRLTTIISDIAVKMGHRANFCRYSWIDEMIGDATLKMVKAVRDCSFKCYTIAQIISKTTEDDGTLFIAFFDKKGQAQKKELESTDTFFEENGKEYIKFKANPFGYFSRITSHSYLNRIKKEKTLEETKRAFQIETWDKLYSNENFRNVRRPKMVDNDENDYTFEE